MAEANDTPTCTMCGNGFEQRKSQGRPFQKCPDCRDCRAKPAYQKKQYAPRQCQWCGDEFKPKRVDTRFCSSRCMYANKDSRRPPRDRSKDKPTTRQANCVVCGSGFKSYTSTGAPGGWTRCCSDRCGRISRRIRSGSILRISRVTVTSHHGHCEGCGVHYRKSSKDQRFCAPECRPSAYEWEPRKKVCPECEAVFTQERRWQQVCGEACAASARRKTATSAAARRRERMFGQAHDVIDPIKVFDRDGWRCHLCQKRLSPRDRGTYKPLAPELDHVIPLAAGGTHTWGNVACACRRCNIRKGATPMGQIGLPLAA